MAKDKKREKKAKKRKAEEVEDEEEAVQSVDQVSTEEKMIVEDEVQSLESAEDEEESAELDDEIESEEENEEAPEENKPELAGRHDRFREYYMEMLTSEFGDDLDTLRKDKNFNKGSLPILIRALEQGMNIFSAEERKLILEQQS